MRFLSSPGSCSFGVCGDFLWAVPGLCVEGRQPSQFFSLDEDFETSSPFKWLYIGCFSMSCTGVVFMAPSMTRRAMFWTLPSLLLVVLAAVPHVVDAYSISGHTVAV